MVVHRWDKVLAEMQCRPQDLIADVANEIQKKKSAVEDCVTLLPRCED